MVQMELECKSSFWRLTAVACLGEGEKGRGLQYTMALNADVASDQPEFGALEQL